MGVDPGSEWPTVAPETVGVDRVRTESLVAFALEHPSDPLRGSDLPGQKSELLRRALGPDADVEIVGPLRQPGDPNGLVLRRDQLITTWGDPSQVDEIASASKSFLSLLAGIAYADGRITDVHGPVSADIDSPLFASAHNRDITWHHLLQQTSEWDGSVFGKSPTGHRGQRIGEPLHEPGTFWEYNDVRVNVLALALLEVFGEPIEEVLRERVMDPIGGSADWSWHGYSTSWVTVDGRQMQSVSGGSHWGGGIWMSSRDLARVGSLYLAAATGRDHPALASAWVARTRTSCERNYMYGYLWWLQHDDAGNQVCFSAQGGGSHQCIVVPDHELVVVARWVQDAAWPGLIDRALALVDDRPSLGPVDYDFARVNP